MFFFAPDLPIATVEPIEARREAPPSLRVPLHEPSSKLSQSSGELAREPQPAKDVYIEYGKSINTISESRVAATHADVILVPSNKRARKHLIGVIEK